MNSLSLSIWIKQAVNCLLGLKSTFWTVLISIRSHTGVSHHLFSVFLLLLFLIFVLCLMSNVTCFPELSTCYCPFGSLYNVYLKHKKLWRLHQSDVKGVIISGQNIKIISGVISFLWLVLIFPLKQLRNPIFGSYT